VQVRAVEERDTVSMIVQDDGPGIPTTERARVVDRFYRLDQSRSLPGNGLGLSIVAAIASLHWGALDLADASPGLVARIVLPRADTCLPPSGNLSRETLRLENSDLGLQRLSSSTRPNFLRTAFGERRGRLLNGARLVLGLR
jgi:hypothetical protein